MANLYSHHVSVANVLYQLSLLHKLSRCSHPGMFVEVHAGFRGDVLGADDLTVSLKSLELEELGC